MSYPIEPLPKRDEMQAEIVTCVMIYNAETNEVLVQNRTKKYPDWSFPGGHVSRKQKNHCHQPARILDNGQRFVCGLMNCGNIFKMFFIG